MSNEFEENYYFLRFLYTANMTHDPLFTFDYSVNESRPVLAKEAIDVNGDGKVWKIILNDSFDIVSA